MTGSRRCGLERSALLLGRERVGELAQIAVQDLIEPVERQLDAVIGDPTLGEVVGANLLRPLARADLQSPGRRLLVLMALALALVEEGAQDAHRPRLVLELRALVLHRDDKSGRQVSEANSGVSRVDRLATRPTRVIDVDLQ